MTKVPDSLHCIPGINWLRALLSVAVVVWHLGSFGISSIFDRTNYAHHVFTPSDLVNFHVLVVAVPTFFLISCYLYARKNPAAPYLKQRIVRFMVLALVWTVAGKTWLAGYQGLLSLRPTSVASFITIVFSSGLTLYYFFISLIILTGITHVCLRLSTTTNAVLFALACIYVFIAPAIAIRYSLYGMCALWNPMNFIPYPFVAILTARNERLFVQRGSQLAIIGVFLVAAVLFGFYEWRFYVHEGFFDGQPYALPAYTRLSVVCMAVVLFAVGLTKTIRTNRIIDFMSKQSLALYCLHPFVIVFGSQYFPLDRLTFSPIFIETLKITMVLLACYTASVLLKERILGKYVLP